MPWVLPNCFRLLGAPSEAAASTNINNMEVVYVHMTRKTRHAGITGNIQTQNKHGNILKKIHNVDHTYYLNSLHNIQTTTIFQTSAQSPKTYLSALLAAASDEACNERKLAQEMR